MSTKGLVKKITSYHTNQKEARDEAGHYQRSAEHVLTLFELMCEGTQEKMKVHFHGYVPLEYERKLVRFSEDESEWDMDGKQVTRLNQSLSTIDKSLPILLASYSKERMQKED